MNFLNVHLFKVRATSVLILRQKRKKRLLNRRDGKGPNQKIMPVYVLTLMTTFSRLIIFNETFIVFLTLIDEIK